MQFFPTEKHKEISLAAGLNALRDGTISKLYSDGLDENEYIYWNEETGFCYEDDCVIGGTFDRALDRLHALKWCFSHKFYAIY